MDVNFTGHVNQSIAENLVYPVDIMTDTLGDYCRSENSNSGMGILFCFSTFIFAYRCEYVNRYGEADWGGRSNDIVGRCLGILGPKYFGVETDQQFNEFQKNTITLLNESQSVYAEGCEAIWDAEDNDPTKSVFHRMAMWLMNHLEIAEKDSHLIGNMMNKMSKHWDENIDIEAQEKLIEDLGFKL